jgi:hypothetical protein
LGVIESALLSAFVTPAKQDDEFASALIEIDAIARPMIDPHFREASACMFHISKIAIASSSNPVDDFGRGLAITQRIKPFDKLCCFPNLKGLSFV